MPHLELSLLGSFRAKLDGEPVTGFQSSKARALLAYLLARSLAPSPHWGDGAGRVSCGPRQGIYWPSSLAVTRRCQVSAVENWASPRFVVSYVSGNGFAYIIAGCGSEEG
jgi:hypothetical protein